MLLDNFTKNTILHTMDEIKKEQSGRPRKADSELIVYKSFNFYFPKEFADIMSEFEKICARKIGEFPYDARCKSIFIRRFIIQCVLKNSANDSIKKQCIEFKTAEAERIEKLKLNFLKRRRK